MPADAGIRFGQYVLVRRIARGGMAEVFLAQQRGLEGFDRRVAVKRILPHLADSPDFVKMFLGEARLAAQLAHPNIVHIYEFGKVEHDYFIAMEFVDGVHAGQLFKHRETEKLPPTLVARIGADAANALHYAHELRSSSGTSYGLVHRDVSPANIMISYDGVVKLCDFGIAKAAAAGDQLTNPGQVKGKYAYMSPEQTIAAPLDGRSDVFSLAIVLWELLTGRFIVPRGDAVAAMRMIRDGKLESIANVAPDVPPPLARAITWALEPKRDKRATAAELAQALEAFIKSSPELATSMQLGAWVRARFTRESTGQIPALPAGDGPPAAGTQVQPGTVAAPGTIAGVTTPPPPPPTVPPTPVPEPPAAPQMYPPRRVVKLLADTGEGTEIYTVSDLEDSLTVKGPRPRPPAFTTPSSAQTVVAPPNRAAEEATVQGGPPVLVGDETEVVDTRHLPRPDPDEDDSDNDETILNDHRTPVPSAPASVPTRVQAPLSETLVVPPPVPGITPPPDGMHAQPIKAQTLRGTGTQAVLPRRASSPGIVKGSRRGSTASTRGMPRKELVLAIAGLGGLMLVSFLIALAASSRGNDRPAAAPDAAMIVAAPADAAPADATLPLAPPPADAAPTVPSIDAAPEPGPEMAYLAVRTIPDGGTITVGDQTEVATAQPDDPRGIATAKLVLPAGEHLVIAELAGYRPEQRTVILEGGVNKVIEIAFTKKIAKERAPATGRLTVRTTPWSDVYLGQKKLGQAPFADLELPVGTHTLTFKNPSRPQVTRTVTIRAGKATKLNFSLP